MPIRKLLSVLLALVFGLLIGELLAARRDHWGFPHYNGYIADAALGVRLQPDYDTVLAFKDNPPGAIHVNHQGYRGADWPEGRTGEIAVIGDSQVFGLGVGDDETLPAQLEKALGAPVLNLGVPTYGPEEYLALIDEIAPRKPSTIILEINFANDLFELDAPDRTRHVVLDGWAVRGDTLPTTVPFPGRSWLFQKSHLVFAARTLLHRPSEVEGAAEEPAPSKEPVESRDAAATATLTATAPTQAGVSPEDVYSQVRSAIQALQDAEDQVISTWLAVSGAEDTFTWADALREARGGARVGDIVEHNFAEESFRVEITAGWLRQARQLRQEAPEKLAAWVLAHPRDPERKGSANALHALSEARDRVTSLGDLVPQDAGRPSAFRRFLADARGRAQRAGAQLVVVAMPLDIQVDSREFAKYGEQPRDMTDSLGLLTDLCADAAHLGLRCADPTTALRGKEPGMFLDGDIHLTAAGQRVLTDVVVEALHGAAPPARPFLGIPEGRSRFPDPLEWETVGENLVSGSSRNGCRTQQLREYLQVRCRPVVISFLQDGKPWKPLPDEALPDFPWNVERVYGPRPTGVGVREGPLDRLVWSSDEEVGLIIPLLPDRPVVADFTWADHAERLTVPAGPVEAGKPVGAFTPISADQAVKAESVAQDCSPGQLRGGVTGVCLDPCESDRSCKAGRCTDWAGLNLCI